MTLAATIHYRKKKENNLYSSYVSVGVKDSTVLVPIPVLKANLSVGDIEAAKNLTNSGFYLGFFVWGRRSELKLMVCGRRLLFSRGVWGHAPWKIFKFLSLLRVILRHFKTVLRS